MILTGPSSEGRNGRDYKLGEVGRVLSNDLEVQECDATGDK
jgi:hypothetical protein